MFNTLRRPAGSTIQNRLLRIMPPGVIDYLRPRLKRVPLTLRAILLKPDHAPESVYFIESGAVSMIAVLETGEQVEVGLVGLEGFVGLPVLLGAPTSPIEALVQSEGEALRISAAGFRTAMAELPAMTGPLLRYVDAFMLQVSQAAVCNTHHRLEQRLARWILMTQDRVGRDTFAMTQQFMSHMLGVQRPTVTLVVGTLHRAGLIQHGEGRIHVLDRAGLEMVACECYDVVRQRFAWLMSPGDMAAREHHHR